MLLIVNKRKPKLTKVVDTSLFSIKEIVVIIATYTNSPHFDIEIGNLDTLFTNLKKGQTC